MALRIAVAGVGRRGRQWAQQIARSGRHELAACADPRESARVAVAANLGLPPELCHATLEEALDAHPCDAVVVATPHHDHRRTAEVAISRQIPTLVEKPLATSLEDAGAVVNLAESRGVPVVVSQNLRYTRGHRTLARLVREGAVGQVRMVVCQSYRVPELESPDPVFPHRIAWGTSVHDLDALRHTVGELSGVMAETFGGPQQSKSIHALLAFENGARGVYLATFESSGHQFFERGQEFYERVIGEHGTAHMNQRWVFLCPNGKLPHPVRRGRRPRTEEAILIDQLEHAARTGEEPDASGRDNLRTIAAVEACVRSAETGAWADPRGLTSRLPA
jgi:predicted dehydrogenase